MRWDDFLDTAGRLARGATEGDWRSGISRAYYAVFHYFREFFGANGLDIGQGAGQAHSNLYLGLHNCGFPAVELLAGEIDQLRRDRSATDYDLTRPLDQRSASRSIGKANTIVTTFQTQLTTIPAAQIVDGARRHLKAIGRIP